MIPTAVLLVFAVVVFLAVLSPATRRQYPGDRARQRRSALGFTLLLLPLVLVVFLVTDLHHPG